MCSSLVSNHKSESNFLFIVKKGSIRRFRSCRIDDAHIQKLFDRETPLECLKRLAESYDSRGGEGDTLQGALADAVLCLRNEGNRNGWLNGGEFDAECIDLLKKYLCDHPIGGPCI